MLNPSVKEIAINSEIDDYYKEFVKCVEKGMTYCAFSIRLSPDCAYTHMNAILHKARLLDIRFHDLRHIFATQRHRKRRGRQDPVRDLEGTLMPATLDTYTHVTPDIHEAASGIVGGFMEDLLGKDPANKKTSPN